MPRSQCLSNIKLSCCNLTYVLHDDHTVQVFSLTRPSSDLCLSWQQADTISNNVLSSRASERSVLWNKYSYYWRKTYLKRCKHAHFLDHLHRCVHATHARTGVCVARHAGASWNLERRESRLSCYCHILQKLLTQHQDCDTRSLHQTRYSQSENKCQRHWGILTTRWQDILEHSASYPKHLHKLCTD